jgi:LPS-assembly protein
VKADHLKYDQETGIISASGSVEIYFEDAVINSNTAIIDLNANIASAEGNVRIKRKDYNIYSSSLTYDISEETAVAFKIKTVFYPTDIKSNLYFASYKIIDLPGLKMGEYGSLTTCDYDEPHYHMESRWFDYYPDDKVVGYLVTLYAGPVPVLWTPYYVFNLKKRRSPFSFVYGQNEVEGRFLKTSFDYFINNSAYGIFYFDTTEKKGPGYGVGHEYILNDSNSGSLYYYRMDERDTYLNDYVFRLTHNLKIDDYSKMTLSHNSAFIYQVPSGRKYDNSSSIGYSRDEGGHKLNYNYSVTNDQYTFLNTEAFNINNRDGSYNTGFSWDQSKSLKAPNWKSSHDRFFHDQSLWTDDAKLSVNVNYSSYVTDEGYDADEKLEPQIDLTYKGSFYTAKLTQNWYVDMDERRYRGDDNYEYLERLPQLDISFNPVDMYYFTLNSNVGLARFHEAKYVSEFSRMRHITTNRYSVGAGISRSDNLGLGTVLRSGLGVDQFAYELGDQRFQYRESLNMETNLGGFFRNNADWGRARVAGNTPFFFESLGSQYNYIKDRITLYHQNIVTWTIDGGYNYMNSTYDDVMTGLSVTPNEKLRFSVNTGWSIENQRYRDLVTAVTVTPFPKFVNTASLVYDMNVGKLMSANSIMDLEIGDTWEDRWHFKMGHSYDLFMDRYMLRDLAIVKDLHCWEAVFTYNDYLKEYRFGMSLKAFPEYPISYIAGQGGNYFNSFMNNMHFEQDSPRRY